MSHLHVYNQGTYGLPAKKKRTRAAPAPPAVVPSTSVVAPVATAQVSNSSQPPDALEQACQSAGILTETACSVTESNAGRHTITNTEFHIPLSFQCKSSFYDLILCAFVGSRDFFPEKRTSCPWQEATVCCSK